MRLIDADELIKDRIENDPVRIAAMYAPTAYDMDKTVKRLEEEYLACRCKNPERCTYPESIGCCYDRAIKNAIDIVHSGGIAPEKPQSKDGKYMKDRESFFKE